MSKRSKPPQPKGRPPRRKGREADYGDATPEDVARALHRYRPKKPQAPDKAPAP